MPRLTVLDDYQRVANRFGDWKALPRGVDVEVLTEHLTDEDALAARLQDSFAVMCIRERTPLQRSLLERLPRLSLICNTGMVNAAIDVQAATDLGILMCGTDSYHSRSTPELTWGLIIALTRHIAVEDQAVRQGRWQTAIGPELQGLTLGLLGLGRIGTQMATVAHVFGMKVIAWSQNLTPQRCAEAGVGYVDKDGLMAQADIVSIHLRLSDRTRGLVAARELALMKPTAYLVNTSRGPIVDEGALVDALRRKAIAGAALDTFDTEPLPLDHPLRAMPNTVVTPHIGYVSIPGYESYYRDTVENINAYFAGKPLRVINPEVLESPALRPRP